MAISLRLNTRRRTAVATTTRLPRYARNDKAGTHETIQTLDIQHGYSGANRNPDGLNQKILSIPVK